MTSFLRGISLFAVSAFLLLAGCTDDRSVPRSEPAAIEDVANATPSPANIQARIDNGQHLFIDFCASCHGFDGSGDGPVAEFLNVPLPDLRLLKQNHGGTFPAQHVFETIEGSDDARAHGTRDMPVWGNVWSEEDGVAVQLDVVQRRIDEIVEYVRTLQITNGGS